MMTLGHLNAELVRLRERLGERERKDVGEHGDFEVSVDGFERFADYFFDGLIVDWMVQSKIKRAQESVARVARDVERSLGEMRSRLATVDEELTELSAERLRRIEEYTG